MKLLLQRVTRPDILPVVASSADEPAKPFKGLQGSWLIVYDSTTKKFMLGRRAPYCKLDVGLWNFIGGGVDKGETPKQAAVREFKEEAGYEFDQANVTHLLSVANPVKGGKCHFFVAQVPDGFQVKTNAEHDKIVWLPLGGEKGSILTFIPYLTWPTQAVLGALYAYMSERTGR